jgi:predicted kinase
MPGLIVIGGAPGCGKSTLATALRAHFHGPWIDFGRLREFHLEADWSNQSPEEETIAFENLVSIIRNYLKHGYANILIDDLRDHRIRQIGGLFAENSAHVLTLFVSDPSELRRRIVTRNDGWKNADAAIAWNQAVIDRAAGDREVKIDTACLSPAQVFAKSLGIISVSTRG